MIMDEMKDIMVPTTEVQTWLWKLLTHQNSSSAVCGKVTKINVNLVNYVPTSYLHPKQYIIFCICSLTFIRVTIEERWSQRTPY